MAKNSVSVDRATLMNSIRYKQKKAGFPNASENMDFRGLNYHQLIQINNSWDSYPKCLDVYPTQLTEKHYEGIN